MILTQSRYAQGTAFERKVILDLAGEGYVTIRAAGSKGAGKIDVVAFHPYGPQLLIQCKRTGEISPGEWNRVREIARWAGAVPLLAENGPNGRGITYWRLVADKVPRSHSKPRELYDIHVRTTLVEVVDH
jgi:Holliday junction resolvase